MIKGLISGLSVIAFMLAVIAVETWRTAKKAKDPWLERFNAYMMMFAAVLVVVLVMALATTANARDLGQWTNSDPAIHDWYQHLTRPDVPSGICCTEADAYWADEYFFKDGKMYARITDTRPDEPLGRPHIEDGTVFEIPPEKLKWDQSNPTGHGVLFISTAGYTWCYVQPGGA